MDRLDSGVFMKHRDYITKFGLPFFFSVLFVNKLGGSVEVVDLGEDVSVNFELPFSLIGYESSEKKKLAGFSKHIGTKSDTKKFFEGVVF